MSRANKKYVARQLILQELFQREYSNHHYLDDAKTNFISESIIDEYDHKYYARIIKGLRDTMPSINAEINNFIDRDVNSLNKVELCILRLGIYEMLYCDDVPFKVVIDQSTKLAQAYGAESGYKYVNGVLDNVAKKHRELEYSAVHKNK
jgi:transcription antitermination protein NusB